MAQPTLKRLGALLVPIILCFSAHEAAAQNCVASFTVSGNAPACAPPVTVTYTNTSVNADSFQWYFPGGQPSLFTGATPPPIVYNSCGQFDASLQVSNAAGCSDAFWMQAVQINCPNVNISFDETLMENAQLCAPSTVSFNAASASLQNGIFDWNFDYNPLSPIFTSLNSGSSVSHTFTDAGCYHIAVRAYTVSPACTAVAVLSMPLCIGTLSGAPALSASVSTSQTCAGDSVTLTIDSPAPVSPGCDVRYRVIWGDGTDTLFDAGVSQFKHRFTDTALVDCFDITVIRQVCYCADTLVLTDAVCVKPPLANVVFTQSCNAPLCVVADASVSIGVNVYDWSQTAGFDSSYVSPNGALANFCFPQSETQYPIVLTVYDTVSGCAMTWVDTVMTYGGSFSFSIGTPEVCIGAIMPYTVSSSGLFVSATWKFFDASNDSLLGTSTGGWWPMNGFFIPHPGCINIRLIMTDMLGCKDSVQVDSAVCAYGSIVDFQPLFNFGCAPLTVDFAGNAVPLHGDIVAYNWDFGDSTTSSLQHPQHTYTETGFYTVKHCVTTAAASGFECVQCKTLNKAVMVGAAFTQNVGAPQTNQDIIFQTLPLPDATYAWSVTPAAGQTILTPPDSNVFAVSFHQGGVYDVCLVLNTPVCTDTHCTSINVIDTHADYATAQQPDLLIFPNPAGDVLTLGLPGLPGVNALVRLFALDGRMVYTNVILLSGEATRIDVSSLPAGMYLVRVTTPQYAAIGRVNIAR